MTEKQLEKARSIRTELSRLNRLVSLLEQAYNDDFDLTHYDENLKAYVNIWLYLTAEEQNDIIQQIKQYIKAHSDQKQQEFAAL
uniref:hypothetical protein n=1 Tax=Alloprevotella sp. TaxID=1872471 RepID=UPI0040299ABB